MNFAIFIYITVVFYFPIISTEKFVEIFQIPKKDFVTVKESVLISCRGKIQSLDGFMFRRNGIIISLNCSQWGPEKFRMSCNKIGSWNYMNLTIESVSWMNRGEYICVNDPHVVKLDLPVSVPSVLSILVGEISYNTKPAIVNSQYQIEKLKGKGSKENPYKLLSRDIKSVNVNCSSNFSFPPPKIQWTVTQIFPDDQMSGAQPFNEIKSSKFLTDEPENKGLYLTSSILQLDCQQQKWHSLLKVQCYNSDRKERVENSASAYFLCPDSDSYIKANSSRVTTKKVLGKITTGEIVNIIIGCLIGSILLISGIVLICRHRSKDDLDRYTMRQNSMEHSGYRV